MTRKKVMAVLLALTMAASLMICSPVVSMAAGTAMRVVDVDFTKDGAPIYGICDGEIGADVYLESYVDEDVNVFASVAMFDGSGALTDISFNRKEVPANTMKTKVSVSPVSTSASGEYRIRLWDSSLNPLCDDILLPQSDMEKTITSFKATIGDYTYNADINEYTKEITIYVPTRYIASDESVGYVPKTGADHGMANSSANVKNAIAKGITPVIEGVGTIEGIGESKDFSKPVEYKVKAADGSEVVYTARIIENDSRMFHKPGTSQFTEIALPHPRSGWRVKNSGSYEPAGSYAWLSADHSAATSFVENSGENEAPKALQVSKTNPSTNDCFYVYGVNRPRNVGYQQTQIAEVNMKITDLTEGDGFYISYFETDGNNEKNVNLIFKKVPGTNTMELYWSRGGVDRGAKIDTAAPINMGEMHRYRVVRQMNPEKLSTGKYQSVTALYVDGKYIASAVDSNFASFDGEKGQYAHNGAYNMMMFGNVTSDTAANGGVTYTVALEEIKFQSVQYDEAVTSASAELGNITVAGKEYKPLYKEGVYTYIVPSDADLTGIVPSVTPVSKYASVTSTEGALTDESGMTITVVNSLTGAQEILTAKATKMNLMLSEDFTGETLDEALGEGFTVNAGNATLEADPTNAENKAVKIVKTGKNWTTYFSIAADAPANTNGYATSFKVMSEETSGGSGYPVFNVSTLGKAGPVIDIYRGEEGEGNSTYGGRFGVRGQRESIDASGSTFATGYIALNDDGVTQLRAKFNEWHEITYILVPSSDTENYPYGFYLDFYVDGVHKITYKDGIGLGNKTPLGEITDAHKFINVPFSLSPYGGFNSNGTFYFDDIETYYVPAQ